MKLVGEYELTDNGVVIEGQIKDSHIHDIRRLLAPFKTHRMYKGDVQETSRVYHVPHNKYRKYIRKTLPKILTIETERKFVSFGSDNINDFGVYYDDAVTFASNMGIMYGDGDGRSIIMERSMYKYQKQMRSTRMFLTNSAWVWTADERGNFKIELEGMVNRHMMTMLIGNATKLARHIDEVLVKVLDHEDQFTAEKLASFSYQSW